MASQVLYGFESLWLSESLLDGNNHEKLANAIFATTRYRGVMLQFNKALARPRPGVIAAVKDTATNPCVCTSFALAIVADGQRPAYPGIPNHEPDVNQGRKAAENGRTSTRYAPALTKPSATKAVLSEWI